MLKRLLIILTTIICPLLSMIVLLLFTTLYDSSNSSDLWDAFTIGFTIWVLCAFYLTLYFIGGGISG